MMRNDGVKLFSVNICVLCLSSRRPAPCTKPGATLCRHAGPHTAALRLEHRPCSARRGSRVSFLGFFFLYVGVINCPPVSKTKSRRIAESRDCFAWLNFDLEGSKQIEIVSPVWRCSNKLQKKMKVGAMCVLLLMDTPWIQRVTACSKSLFSKVKCPNFINGSKPDEF